MSVDSFRFTAGRTQWIIDGLDGTLVGDRADSRMWARISISVV